MRDPRDLVITGTRKGIARHLAEHYCGIGDAVGGCSREASDWRHPSNLNHCLDVTEEADDKKMFLDVVRRVTTLYPEGPRAFATRIKAFCRERLQPYKVPVKLAILGDRQYSDRFKKTRPLDT